MADRRDAHERAAGHVPISIHHARANGDAESSNEE